ncbi:hypothetical protein [Rubrivivax sp. JA1026]|uniref:hypothetical protein n=1 Tax=Rubrivivax sp. JA1026 TaxID=2710888 RepID=UPI0013E8F987|nr:hypothetical protein [Rubrivivax sp. JA1026]
MKPSPVATGIEALVCEDIARRQAMGLAKYGQTLADNPAPLRERLQHMYEELLDGANYCRWAIAQLDGQDIAQPETATQPPVRLELRVDAQRRTAVCSALHDFAERLLDEDMPIGAFAIHHDHGGLLEGEFLEHPAAAAATPTGDPL